MTSADGHGLLADGDGLHQSYEICKLYICDVPV